MESYDAPVVIATPSGSQANRMSVMIHVAADVFAPEIICRHANGWLLDHVSNLMHTEEPQLFVSKQLIWRVKVFFTLPSHGKVGQVGTLDLDAITGEVLMQEIVTRGLVLYEATHA